MTKKLERSASRECNQELVDFLITWGSLSLWLVMTYGLGGAGVWVGLKCFDAWPQQIGCAVVMVAPVLLCLLFWRWIWVQLINLGYWVHAKRMKRLHLQGKQVSRLGFWSLKVSWLCSHRLSHYRIITFSTWSALTNWTTPVSISPTWNNDGALKITPIETDYEGPFTSWSSSRTIRPASGHKCITNDDCMYQRRNTQSKK